MVNQTTAKDRKLNGDTFRLEATRLLSGVERNNLLATIKRFQQDQSIRRLTTALLALLDTQEKRQLLRHVRKLIPANRLKQFDEEILTLSSSTNSSERNSNYSNHKRNGTHHNNKSEYPNVAPKSFRIVNLQRTQGRSENLGFSLTGGKEHGSGIFVSKVVRYSVAENADLRQNDEIIEVNGISLKSMNLHSATKLLSSLKRLKLVVRGTISDRITDADSPDKPKQDPASRIQATTTETNIPTIVTKSATPDSESELNPRKLSETRDGEFLPPPDSMIQLRRNSSILNGSDSDDERRINLIVESTPTGFIGFCIRGGSEYGLGIYISRVDPNSTAEECGLQAGDQILDANGVGFEKIRHKDAVKYIKSHEHIILTVKAVGRIPESKCLVAEYSWLAPDGTKLVDKPSAGERLSKSLPSSALRTIEDQSSSEETADSQLNQTSKSLPLTSVAIQTGEEEDPFETQFFNLNENNTRNGITNSHEDVDIELSMLMSSRTNDSNGENDVTFAHGKTTPSPRLSDSMNSKMRLGSRPSLSSVNSIEDFETLWHIDDKSQQRLAKQKSFLQRQSDKLMAKLNFKKKSKSETDANQAQDNFFDKTGNVQLWIKYVDGEARKLLDNDGYRTLMDQLYDYLEKGDVELLTRNCIDVLDSPEKWPLLNAIRTIVFPYDISRFDARISRFELEEINTSEIDEEFIDCPLSDKPPKRTLITAVQGKSGKFQLRSTAEAEILEKEKEQKEKITSKKYFHAKTILDRDRSIQRYNSFTDMPRPSPYFGRGAIALPESDLDETPIKEQMEESSTSHLYASVNHDETDEEIENATKASKSLFLSIPTIEEPRTLDGSYVNISSNADQLERNLSRTIDPDTERVMHLEAEREDDAYEPIGDSVKQSKKRRLQIVKNKQTLGISISGGLGSVAQPEIRIEHVYPGGAASDVEGLKAGVHLLSIDEHSLIGATHKDAVDWIRQSFQNKQEPYMTFEVDDL